MKCSQEICISKDGRYTERGWAKEEGKWWEAKQFATEEMLLMVLGHLREYRTYFYVASFDGISENSCYRNIRWI